MHFFFNIGIFVALSQTWKVKAVKFLHWRFVPFQNTNSYPFRIKTRNIEKILFMLKWRSCEVWIYVINSSVMEMKYVLYKLLMNNSCKENLDFSICYLSKVWNPRARKCFILYSKEPVEFSACRVFCCWWWFFVCFLVSQCQSSTDLVGEGQTVLHLRETKWVKKTEIGG